MFAGIKNSDEGVATGGRKWEFGSSQILIGKRETKGKRVKTRTVIYMLGDALPPQRSKCTTAH